MNILLSFLVALIISNSLPKVQETVKQPNNVKLLIESPHQQKDSTLKNASVCQLHQLEKGCN